MELEMDSVHGGIAWTNTTQKHVHTFDFVRYQMYRDPLIMRKIEDATLEFQLKKEEIEHLNKELRQILGEKRSIERSYRYKTCCDYERYYKDRIEGTKRDLALVKEYLNEDSRKKQMRVHSPEEEKLFNWRNELKHSLRNKNLSLKEEKKMMKKMKELQVEREEVKSDELSEFKEAQTREKRHNEWRISWATRNQPQKKWIENIQERIDKLKRKQLDNSIKMKEWRKDLRALDWEKKKFQQKINVQNYKLNKMNKELLNYQKMKDETEFSRLYLNFII